MSHEFWEPPDRSIKECAGCAKHRRTIAKLKKMTKIMREALGEIIRVGKGREYMGQSIIALNACVDVRRAELE